VRRPAAFRCCPSSLYTFPPMRAWLGIAIAEVSPNLGSSAPRVSPRALKTGSSPLRLPVPPRPRDPAGIAKKGITTNYARRPSRTAPSNSR
jgi:hypothetical protein